jgi:radical SAM protein with 4Fe4S-binding SPASM domain
VVGEFAAMGGCGIRFTGGEPLCHSGWLESVRQACSLGFRAVALQTNAMLLSDEHVSALRNLNFAALSIQVSLDGALPSTHDLVRGAGSFSAALRGIEKLVQGGLGDRVSLFFTEMRHNLEEIPALLDLADGIGVSSVSTGTLVRCGRASGSSELEQPGIEQYRNLLECYNRDSHFRELYRRIGNVAALEWRDGDTVSQDCCTFVENPYLSPSGRLYPCLLCHADDYSVTGVFEKGLGGALAEGIPLWQSLRDISSSRARAIPECQDCPGRHSCGGGCLGRAWGSYGNLLAADDRCSVRRDVLSLCRR